MTTTLRRGRRPDPAATAPRRCLVVDDHPAVRLGLQNLLAGDPGLTVVGAHATAEEALDDAVRRPVDVAVVDYGLGGRSGLWLTRRLVALPEAPRVVIYSGHSDHLLAAGCIVAGASALVSKAALGETLIACVYEAAQGQSRPPGVPPALADSVRRRLEPAQQAIFGLLASGASPAEAAGALRMSEAHIDIELWRMLSALAPARSDDVDRRRSAA